MRGLLFTGGLQPDPTLIREYCGTADLVVAADSGLESALKAGFAADLAVGDMDSLSDLTLLDRLPAGSVQRWNTDKDYSDTELAIQAMRSRGITDITLIGGGGGRLDHLLALYQLFEMENPPGLWISDFSLLFPLGEGCAAASVSVTGLRAESAVSVIPVKGTAVRVRSNGLQWPLDNLDWLQTRLSLSNRAPQGRCSVLVESGRVLVVLPLMFGLGLEIGSNSSV